MKNSGSLASGRVSNTWVVVIVAAACALATFRAGAVDDIPRWSRHVIALQNDSYSGNPFELEIDAVFTHIDSGVVLTLPGYYAGDDIWKVGFMPTLVGEWAYRTLSPDPDLHDVTGTLTAVPSEHPGLLKGDNVAIRKWKFTDGSYVVPIALRFDVFQENGTLDRFGEVADFLRDDVGGHMFEFTLRNEVFSDVQAKEFDLALWDRLEQRMNVLAERRLGVHFMFYSDDDQEPRWSGQSATEQLLIRYVVARLAAYPILVINTGIDIAEYRSRSWINWFGRQIRELDPYDHPVSSRYGGGSGNVVMDDQTFDSRGDRLALIEDMAAYFDAASFPVSMDDAWSENAPEAALRNKDFTEHDIRRAIWKCVAAGGLGAIIRGSNLHNNDMWFRISDIEQDLESEQWLRLVNRFVTLELGEQFGAMTPDSSLVTNGYALADTNRSKIFVLFLGENDRYDPIHDDSMTLHLDAVRDPYSVFWFDTRTGDKLFLPDVMGGGDVVFRPPSQDDWVLLLSRSALDALDPSPPGSLRIQ